MMDGQEGGVPETLGHQDPDHVLFRVDIPGCAVAAIPAVPSRDIGHVVAPCDSLVIMDTPKPQPRLSQKPGKKGDTAFCSGLMWSVVISSTESRERIRSRPCLPWFSIIRPKASKSSTVAACRVPSRTLFSWSSFPPSS